MNSSPFVEKIYQRAMREYHGYDPDDESIEFLTEKDQLDLLYWGR